MISATQELQPVMNFFNSDVIDSNTRSVPTERAILWICNLHDFSQQHSKTKTFSFVSYELDSNFDLIVIVAFCSETIFSEAVKTNIPGKLPTFNQQWTIAEQVIIYI